jgi:uncharacterized membrane protein HdeD (DUF308 family)
MQGMALHYGETRGGTTRWYKALTVGVGILSIVLAVIIIASPALGIFFIALVLSIALLINGIEMIILGITGRRSGTVLP